MVEEVQGTETATGSNIGAEGDLRPVTVLFVDLVGYTPLAERLGDETLFRIIRPVTERMVACVDEYDGTVQDLTGDGLMAVFGAPKTMEDAPLRACRAALAIRERIGALAADIEAEHGVRPRIRIGIHSGHVVLGRIADQGRDALRVVGDTVNIASRLESEADPDSILISAETFGLVEGFVDAQSAGARQLKGKSEALEVYALTGLKTATDRFSARVVRGLSPCVGRAEELDQLRQEWEKASEGSIHLVAVSGEAGIGKSRLLNEFREQVLDDSAVVLQGHCTSDGTAVPFQPFVEVIRRSFRIGDAQDAKTINARLRDGLSILGLADTDFERYLANLLTGVRDERLVDIDGERLGRGTLEAIQGCLKARCRLSPTVLIIEDLHWVDPQTESILSWLAGTADDVPLLVLCTFRPGYTRAWLNAERVVPVELNELGTKEMEALYRFRLNAEELSSSLGAQLLDRAGGNPLFAEEIASYMAGSGRIQVSNGIASLGNTGEASGVPHSLTNILLDRVDRFDEEVRTVLSVASVIGRRFDADVVGQVAGMNGKVVPHLEFLKDQEIIFSERRTGSWFRFKHALIQDAIYGRLFSTEREALHKSVAEALEDLHKGAEAEVAEALAHHYGQTGVVEKTIRYLSLAGQKSLDVYAIELASARFVEALALAEANPGVLNASETADLVLSIIRMYTLSGDFENLSSTDRKYRAHFEGLDNPAKFARYLHEIGLCHVFDGHPDVATIEIDQCNTLATEIGDERAVAYAYMAKAWWQTFYGEPCEMHLEKTTKYGDKASEIGRRLKDDFLTVSAEFASAICAGLDGDPSSMRERGNRLLLLAKEDGNLMAHQCALAVLSWISIISYDPEDARSKADEASRLSMTPLIGTQIIGLYGTALALSGRGKEAYEVLHPARELLAQRNFVAALSGIEANYGLSIFLNGEFARGIKWIEDRDKQFSALDFYPTVSGLSNVTLGEIYLNMATNPERPPLLVMLRNLWFLIRTLPVAKRKARKHFEIAANIWRKCPAPAMLAWALCGLGEIATASGKKEAARAYCEEAIELAVTVDAFATADRARNTLDQI